MKLLGSLSTGITLQLGIGTILYHHTIPHARENCFVYTLCYPRLHCCGPTVQTAASIIAVVPYHNREHLQWPAPQLAVKTSLKGTSHSRRDLSNE